jgi:hypothetical protein
MSSPATLCKFLIPAIEQVSSGCGHLSSDYLTLRIMQVLDFIREKGNYLNYLCFFTLQGTTIY